MNCPFHLNDKTILIIGATGGLGYATALLAAEMGASLILTGRKMEKLENLVAELKGNGHRIIKADLCLAADRKQLSEKVPQLDGIVYASGITAHMPASFIGEEHLSSLMKTNFESLVLLTSLLLQKKKINDRASLVFISSVASSLPYVGGSAYSASKAALESYVRTLALELAPKKIRVNALAPTFVETELVKKAEKTISSETMEKMRAIHPLGFGKPEDVAHAAVFLLSDASSWITSEQIRMGGLK